MFLTPFQVSCLYTAFYFSKDGMYTILMLIHFAKHYLSTKILMIQILAAICIIRFISTICPDSFPIAIGRDWHSISIT